MFFYLEGNLTLKEKISKSYIVPIEKLNFNKACLDYIKEVKNHHRVVYLISGSHQLLVNQIDSHLKFFLSHLVQKLILIWLVKIKLNLLRRT